MVLRLAVLLLVAAFATGCAAKGIGYQTEGFGVSLDAGVTSISAEKIGASVCTDFSIEPKVLSCRLPGVEKLLSCPQAPAPNPPTVPPSEGADGTTS